MIVLYDLNVAPLRTKVVINAARELIEKHFAPNDMAAITYTSGLPTRREEFTSDRAALLAAIDKFQGRKLRSTVIEKADYYFSQTLKEMEVNQSDDPNSSAPRSRGRFAGRTGDSDITTDPDDFERGHRARQVLNALGEACQCHGRHPRTAKGNRDVQRRHRLSDYDIFGSQAATLILTEIKMPSPQRPEATSAFLP